MKDQEFQVRVELTSFTAVVDVVYGSQWAGAAIRKELDWEDPASRSVLPARIYPNLSHPAGCSREELERHIAIELHWTSIAQYLDALFTKEETFKDGGEDLRKGIEDFTKNAYRMLIGPLEASGHEPQPVGKSTPPRAFLDTAFSRHESAEPFGLEDEPPF